MDAFRERERETQRVFGSELNYLCLTQCDHSFGPDFLEMAV